jgi:hypothetical protein
MKYGGLVRGSIKIDLEVKDVAEQPEVKSY